MEALFETKSVPAILVFIAIFVLANFLKGAIEFILDLQRKKEQASEASIRELTHELKKFKVDLRRLYIAAKIMAGERWAQIRKEIMEDEGA